MEFFNWILKNFGLFFGAVFMVYLFLVIRRLVALYDVLRFVPSSDEGIPSQVGENKALFFLEAFLNRLKTGVGRASRGADSIIDAIWSEVDCHITVHFTALNGYANTLILIGFAGTIFGSIGAFNEMFRGLAAGQASSMVFVASWNHGLATALYTSLGAAAIGGTLVTLLCSRFLMTRAKRLETLVGLRISEIIQEGQPRADGTEMVKLPKKKPQDASYQKEIACSKT